MPQLSVTAARPRSRRRRCWRWAAEGKAKYLDAFDRSGMGVGAFCRAMDLSPLTFAVWQRAARRRASTPTRAVAPADVTFARVECLTASARERSVTAGGEAIRVVVRAAAGHEATLDGV